jgi:hypothetical protein
VRHISLSLVLSLSLALSRSLSRSLLLSLAHSLFLCEQAVEIFQIDPENNGIDEAVDGDEAIDDICDDTSEEEEEEEEDEEEDDSDSGDDEPASLQAKAEAAAKKRKKKSGGADGMIKRALGTRDPCVMFVLFIMAANLLILPISWVMDL